ncbi:MAG: Kazal-type serine protease inhibitor domain-containing protein [Myxococcota bacterium]
MADLRLPRVAAVVWTLGVSAVSVGCESTVDLGGDRGSGGGTTGPSTTTGTAPNRCGGEDATGCPSGQYCQAPTGVCGGVGTCVPLPDGCTADFRPVCGCDGMTYDNACEAEVAGVGIDTVGACPGESCGGILGVACPSEQFCDFETGGCGFDDGQGVCVARPTDCPETVFDPVCGCDGQTYDSVCFANLAGISVQNQGVCPGDACGGVGGVTCDPTKYCDYPPGPTCGGLDGSGVCRTRPTDCPDIADPVCGCDGNTYGNDCEARAAGIDVATSGPCN